jgi:AcrR family transcriptional regulator
MSTRKRAYRIERRQAKADLTRERVLAAARRMFGRHGFDRTTIAAVAEQAGVSAPLVYALFKSKEGLLRALVDTRVFGEDYARLVATVAQQADPVELLRTVAKITRLVYVTEGRELGFIQRTAILSPPLRKLEEALDRQRYDRQEVVVRRLVELGELRTDLTVAEARDTLWTLTSGEIFRLFARVRKHTAAQYERWLGSLLVDALSNRRPEPGPRR